MSDFDRLSDRDLSVLRAVRFKVGEWTIGDRVAANFTAHESVLLLRVIDFAAAAEQFLRQRDAAAKRAKEIVEETKQIEPTEVQVDESRTKA